MGPSDKAEFDRLRLAVIGSRAAVAAWRELLIESLGDRICGSDAGPTPDEIETLACLEEAQKRASEDYLSFLISTSLKRDRRR